MRNLLFLPLMLLAFALAGCGPTVLTTPVNQTQAYQIENAYGVVQSAAVAYTALPRCKAPASATNICSDRAVIRQLAKADSQARLALNALEAFTRNPANYPGLTYTGLIAAAQQAITVLREIETANGVK